LAKSFAFNIAKYKSLRYAAKRGVLPPDVVRTQPDRAFLENEGVLTMRSILIFCVLAGIGVTSSCGQETASASDSGHAAPEFKFIMLSGEQVFSSSLKGRVLVLDFWSSDCGPCRRSMPQLEEFYRRYRSDPRVAFYFVNSGWETLEKAKAFASSGRSGILGISWGSKYELPFAYDAGSTTLKAFGFDSNPSTVIIDQRFLIRIRHSGYIEKFYDYLKENVERCLRRQ
jgi:thiol-disulfide isomerase/thioredoxin